jgi:haloacetate dehalogenase
VFEGFTRRRVAVGDVGIECVVGGAGPPLLLLHGYPQTHAQWAKLAPLLTARHTVVCSDLRGYGDSSKPADTGETYSFRAMAADQLALMTQLGFDRFHVAGHDRGGRVAHRLALDAQDRVLSLTALDLVPTWTMYARASRRLAARYWQWYFLPQPGPFAEQMIAAAPDLWFEHCLVSNGGEGLKAYDDEMLAEYRRCWSDPAMIHASTADYKAGATVDLEHDEADLDVKLPCPVLACWGADGLMKEQFDIGAEWRERCADVRTATVPGGHFFPEHAPEETAEVLLAFTAR